MGFLYHEISLNKVSFRNFLQKNIYNNNIWNIIYYIISTNKKIIKSIILMAKFFKLENMATTEVLESKVVCL